MKARAKRLNSEETVTGYYMVRRVGNTPIHCITKEDVYDWLPIDITTLEFEVFQEWFTEAQIMDKMMDDDSWDYQKVEQMNQKDRLDIPSKTYEKHVRDAQDAAVDLLDFLEAINNAGVGVLKLLIRSDADDSGTRKSVGASASLC